MDATLDDVESTSDKKWSIAMCRACTNECNTHSIFLFENNSDVAQILTKCTSIPISDTDDLPTHICNNCHGQLMGFNKFRLLCTTSDQFFRNHTIETVKLESEPQLEHLISISAEQSNSINDEPDEKKLSELLNMGEGTDIKNESETYHRMPPTEWNTLGSDQEDNKDDDYVDVESTGNASDDDDEDDNDDDDDDEEEKEATKVKPKMKKKNKSKAKGGGKKKTPHNTSSTEMFTCDLCSKRFFKLHRLEGHLRQHRGLKPCECKECGKEFAKWSGLSAHYNAIHGVEKDAKFECDIEGCESIYSRKQSLDAHKRKLHSTQPQVSSEKHICEQCGKTFKTGFNLKHHMYTHTGLMPFKCSLCQKKYPSKHKLKLHTMRHEGIKNHVCPVCGLRKTTSTELKTHMNFHTREKLYPCKLCPSVFSSIGNMTRHVKIVHCGIKELICTYCERSFGKEETLKHHVMTHTGERPHGCSVCGKRFIQKVALKRHMKTHNKG